MDIHARPAPSSTDELHPLWRGFDALWHIRRTLGHSPVNVVPLGQLRADGVGASTFALRVKDDDLDKRALPDRERPTAETELIARVRRGDMGAFGILFKRYQAEVLRYARWCAGELAAEDIASDAFERTLSALRRGAGPTEFFRSYLLACVRNIAADHERRSKAQAAGGLEMLENYAFGTVERDDELWSAFDSLTEKWRKVLWCSEVLEMSLQEQAALWGLSSNSTAALGARARKALRTAYLQVQVTQVAPESVCAPTRLRLAAYLQGTLSRTRRLAVRSHLVQCLGCRRVSTRVIRDNPKLCTPEQA